LISGGKVAAGSGESYYFPRHVANMLKSFRDVAAGIAILEEAGGLVTTANPPADPTTDKIPSNFLGGRLYLAIR
jgi:fructose-1,6-bisphosphatase/inositol monophosphatase family enzyme